MYSLALFACIVVSFTHQASCAPLGGEQVAAREITKEIPKAQSDLTLEKQLRENVKTPHPAKPAQRLPSQNTVYPDDERSEGNAPGEQRESSEKEHLENSEAIPSGNESESPSDNETGSPSDNESTGDLSSSSDKVVVRDSQTDSDNSDSDMSEEEEILRTIIMTLRDNPELIKALIESETEELQDEFYKQKARVSNPADSDGLWGTFQRPSPQVQKMPKQVEKKSGQPVLDSDKRHVREKESKDSPRTQEYEEDVKNEAVDGSRQKAEDEVENGEPDAHRHANPLNVLRTGKIEFPSESDSREQRETYKQGRKNDHSREDETLVNEALHINEHPTDPESEERSGVRVHYPTAEQTAHRVRHRPGNEDNDEDELLALSKTSSSKDARPSGPHM